jgi:hypothetical protein
VSAPESCDVRDFIPSPDRPSFRLGWEDLRPQQKCFSIERNYIYIIFRISPYYFFIFLLLLFSVSHIVSNVANVVISLSLSVCAQKVIKNEDGATPFLSFPIKNFFLFLFPYLISRGHEEEQIKR